MFTLPVRLVSTFFKKSQIQGGNFTFVAKFTITSSDLNLRSQLANLTASGFRRQEISKSYLYRSITLINVDGIKTVIATVWICQTIAVIFDLFPAFFHCKCKVQPNIGYTTAQEEHSNPPQRYSNNF